MSQELLQRLDRTATRVRATATQTAVCLTIAAVIGSAVLIVLVDWLGRFSDPGLRWLFTLTLLGATGAVGVWAWRRRILAGASRLGVAQRLQEIKPELGSRLASAVDFADSDPSDPSAGSAELRRAVVLDAATNAGDLPFDRVIDRRPLAQAGRWLAAAALALAAFAALNANALGTGLVRLAMPWKHAPWPREVELRVIDPPDLLARGAAFEAVAVNDRGPLPEDVRVEYKFSATDYAPAATDAAPAQLVADQAVATRDAVQRSFAYRFIGGDDNTMPWINLRVIDPPVATEFLVQTTPPAYSGLSPDESAGPLRLLAGTGVTLRGVTDKPIDAAQIALPGDTVLQLATAERSFQTEAAGFTAQRAEQQGAKSTYEVRLTDESGVVGIVGPHRYDIVVDQPPKPSWRSTEDAVVTARAIVPILGSVADDLAVARIALAWAPSADAEEAEPQRVAIADFGAEPPPRASLAGEDEHDVDFEWDLEALELEPGAELSLTLIATDYQPADGATPNPRRVLVVSDDEFLSRLAEKQSRLLGQVQQALAMQRDAADATKSLEADTRAADAIDRRALDRLSSVEFAQREAASVVNDPSSGAEASARGLLDELRRSRLDAPTLDSQLDAAARSLGDLAEQTLPAARSELAASRRAGARDDATAKQEFSEGLESATGRQSQAIESLEAVAELLTSWADYQRFAGEAAALEELQRELAAEATKQAAASASQATPDPTDADREKLLVRQAEAARRFDKLRQAMQRLLRSQPEDAPPTAAADAVGDALAEADDADIAGRMRDATRDVATGKPGAASQSQTRAADGLKSMVEALRQRATTDPQELANRLREEKRKLAELQKEIDRLQNQPQGRQTDAARERAASRAARQGRRLQRLTASQAAASAQQGAQQTGPQQDGDQREQLQQAQESFEQAQQEIDQRIAQLEDQQTQRLLDQLKERIDGYIARQELTLEETIGLDSERPGANQETLTRIERTARELALDERELSDELGGFAEKLAKRAVFELALRGAGAQTKDAARRLDEARVDRSTQRVEANALARLKQIKEVLEQTPQPPQEPQDQQGGGGQGGQGGQPPPSPIDVAELKMLRVMQLEVLNETEQYEADTATARRTGKALPADWKATGRNLENRQRRLAELARELAERDNDPEAETP